MTDVSIPGFPRAKAVRVTVAVTLWSDDTSSAFLEVGTAYDGEEFEACHYEQCASRPTAEVGRVMHWATLEQRFILAQLAQPFPPDVWEAIDDARKRYGFLAG